MRYSGSLLTDASTFIDITVELLVPCVVGQCACNGAQGGAGARSTGELAGGDRLLRSHTILISFLQTL